MPHDGDRAFAAAAPAIRLKQLARERIHIAVMLPTSFEDVAVETFTGL